MYGLTLQTAPTHEPVTPAEVKKHVEVAVTDTNHDATLDLLLQAARQMVEDRTGRQLVTATWDLVLDHFPSASDPIRLPKSPAVSVTSITYVDQDGDAQVWASDNYVVSTSREPAEIRCAYGEVYPVPRIQPDAVTVQFVAGYGDAEDVPAGIKALILLIVGHWFETREAVVTGTIATKIPLAADSLFEQYTVGEEFTDYACRAASVSNND